uniref:Uncharacterized protein n=1 Tax=Ditylenchus dipsaci TaxID=166011 RepID=A0A915D6Z0_9BILA
MGADFNISAAAEVIEASYCMKRINGKPELESDSKSSRHVFEPGKGGFYWKKRDAAQSKKNWKIERTKVRRKHSRLCEKKE